MSYILLRLLISAKSLSWSVFALALKLLSYRIQPGSSQVILGAISAELPDTPRLLVHIALFFSECWLKQITNDQTCYSVQSHSSAICKTLFFGLQWYFSHFWKAESWEVQKGQFRQVNFCKSQKSFKSTKKSTWEVNRKYRKVNLKCWKYLMLYDKNFV